MAEYFLGKRRDIKEGNQLMKQFEDIFKMKDQTGSEISSHKNLGGVYNENTMYKEDVPELHPSTMPAVLKLDIAVNKHLHNNSSALSNQLRNYLEKQETEIPDYFDTHDAKKPPEVLIEEAFDSVLTQIFEARRTVEKTLTRGELVAYDHALANMLSHDKLLGRVKHEIYKDYNFLDQMGQDARLLRINSLSEEMQSLKEKSI